MAIIMIAKIKKENSLIGIRLYDTDSKKTMDVPINNAIAVISKGTKVENLEVESGSLKGVNGSLDRYIDINVNGQLTGSKGIYIINKENDKFKVVDWNGNETMLSVDDIISLRDKQNITLANGKLVKTNGGYTVSSIRGEYKEENNSNDRMKELVEVLNKARYAYEQLDKEIMSNYEYDKLYDELLELEKKTGVVMPNSPTINVGTKGINDKEFESVNKLQKEKHETPMLSLDKTKEVDKLKSFLGSHDGMLSWKLDGLTVVLTYNGGKLIKAVTRGNGEIGEVVTHNAIHFKGVPSKIDFKEELVVRGEAVISYSDFEEINKKLPVEAKYKNPRNLSSGSVRQLNSKVSASRNVRFYAFNLVKAGNRQLEYVSDNIKFLEQLGFNFVQTLKVNANNISDAVKKFSENIKSNDIPSDGLVLTYNDIKYGKSLGRTAKFPRHSIAFKWKDDIAETTLREIEWSPSRTGLINPVAIFDPVELEGTTVTRASVHNISIMKELELGLGDKLRVYKANMIIPQIHDNMTRSNNCIIPDICPVCGGPTEIKVIDESEALYCINESCPAKGIKLYTHFVSRDAMNIDGLSEATLQKFVDEGFIESLVDIYNLDNYEDEITSMEGFGVKSYNKLIKSIEKSKNVKLANLIYALGIPNVGLNTAKLICREFDNDLKRTVTAEYSSLTAINGIGDTVAMSFTSYFRNKANVDNFVALIKKLHIIKEEISTDDTMRGLTFCVTGSVEIFPNRRAIKEVIENMGGKLTGSVSKSTSYLVTNDTTSGSNKNKKATEYGIEILTEQQFIDKFNIEV